MVAIPITALEAVGSWFLTPLRARKTRGPVLEVRELVRPEEAQVGVQVRVADSRRAAHVLGAIGTIMRTYRSSERKALHVRLEDGRWQLLWPEEVEVADEE